MEHNRNRLAIHGGPKTISIPLPNRYNTGEEEKQAICALFDRAQESGIAPGYNGIEEEAFCEAFASWMGGGYADGVNSGTTAVFVALRAMEIEPFSEVIVSAITDPGGIMPIVLNNCIPVVADVAPGRYNCGAREIRERITPQTAAIVISHILGEPADVPAMMELAHSHGLKVVEDCSQSHGAALGGRKVGTFGHAAAFSTMFGKHFNTGGQGGVVFTLNEDIYWRIRRHADRGKPFGLPSGATNCVASLNFNLDEIASSIGRVQLKKLPGIVEKRRSLAAYLSRKFSELDSVYVPEQLEGAEPSYWYFRLGFRHGVLACNKSEFLDAVLAEGVSLMKDYSFATPHTFAWMKQKNAFGRGGFPWTAPQYRGNMTGDFYCPNLEASIRDCFNLFLYESWTEREADLIFQAMKKVELAYQ